MKILGITNYNLNNSKAQNFNGLWGKTSRKTDMDGVLFVPKIKDVKYYYPFVDENPADVKEIIESNKSAEIITENNRSKYRIYDCKLGMKLPFNEQQYEAYMQLGEDFKPDKTIDEIHSLVRDKYITNEYGNSQVPALNPNVENRLFSAYV